MTSDNRNHTLRVAIAGGGTGGHIIPALAIAEELQRRIGAHAIFSDIEFLFFGSDYGMENKIVPEAGFPLTTLPIRGLSRSISYSGFKHNLLLPFRMVRSIVRANSELRTFNPHILVGTGGYASAVPVRQALRNNIPVVLQEQNSYPGMVTRLFAVKADQVFLTYEDAEKYLKDANTLMTGNPVRGTLQESDREETAKYFDLKPAVPTMFILGGSQGARAINHHFVERISRYLEKLDIQVLWQTGKADFEYCQRHVGTNSRISLVPFIKDMAKAYSLADLMVCRAGAMTLTEINHFALPSILIPLPSAAGNHQEHNARSQEKVGAARVVLENELAEGAFLPLLTDIFTNKDKLSEMMQASKSMQRPEASVKICDNIIRIVSTSG